MRRIAVVTVLTLLAASTATVALTATIPGGDGTITACRDVKDGTLRAVGSAAECDTRKEEALAWSVTGPAGPAGAVGAQGPAGPAGPQGPPGTGPEEPSSPFEMFLRFERDGAQVGRGDSTAEEFRDWHRVEEFRLGLSVPTTLHTGGGGAATGAVVVDAITIEKELDALTPELRNSIATGRSYDRVDLAICAPPAGTGLVCPLRIQTGLSMVSASTASEAGTETLVIEPTSITWAFTGRAEDGSGVDAGAVTYDRVAKTTSVTSGTPASLGGGSGTAGYLDLGPTVRGQAPWALPAGTAGQPTALDAITFGISSTVDIGSISGGGGAGKAVLAPVAVAKHLDAATPGMLDRLLRGMQLATAGFGTGCQVADGVLQCRDRVEGSNVMLGSYEFDATGQERWTLHTAQQTWEAWAPDDTGVWSRTSD